MSPKIRSSLEAVQDRYCRFLRIKAGSANSLLVVAVFLGTLLFGSYLALLTLLGYENLQALTALDHPGFKHFVRLRVRADGQGIDGWCIGITDPLGAGQQPVLVDHFVWRPFHERLKSSSVAGPPTPVVVGG